MFIFLNCGTLWRLSGRGQLIPNLELGHMAGKDGEPFETYTSKRARIAENLSWLEWGARFNAFLKRVDRVSGKGADIAALVPRVPKAVPGLMQSFSDETRSGEQLAAEIGRDAVLLGNVLRFANSPFYASREPITGIDIVQQQIRIADGYSFP